MREQTPDTITSVLEQLATTPDPRLGATMAAAVDDHHAIARETNLTPTGVSANSWACPMLAPADMVST